MAKAKAAKPKVKGYDQQAVIDGFLKHGQSITELADAQNLGTASRTFVEHADPASRAEP